MAKFFAALASNGAVDGTQILSPETIDKLSEVKATTAGFGFGAAVQWGRGVQKLNFRTPTGVGNSTLFCIISRVFQDFPNLKALQHPAPHTAHAPCDVLCGVPMLIGR